MGLSIFPGESGCEVTVSVSVRLDDDPGSSSGLTPMDRGPDGGHLLLVYKHLIGQSKRFTGTVCLTWSS